MSPVLEGRFDATNAAANAKQLFAKAVGPWRSAFHSFSFALTERFEPILRRWCPIYVHL